MDELQEALEDRMVLLDVAPSDSPRLLEVSPEITEDFPQDDEWPVRPCRPSTTSFLFYM